MVPRKLGQRSADGSSTGPYATTSGSGVHLMASPTHHLRSFICNTVLHARSPHRRSPHRRSRLMQRRVQRSSARTPFGAPRAEAAVSPQVSLLRQPPDHGSFRLLVAASWHPDPGVCAAGFTPSAPLHGIRFVDGHDRHPSTTARDVSRYQFRLLAEWCASQIRGPTTRLDADENVPRLEI